MKRDAHYYAVLALCRACGFKKDDALTVAHASQYVDDAKINLIYFDAAGAGAEPVYNVVNGRPAFFNMATCHSYFWIKTFNYEAMVNNTSVFHFVPGCRGEVFTKRMRCKEESPVIMEILNDVLAEDDLVKLGMVLHAYADTFSHQGFSGLLSKVNDIKDCEAKADIYRGVVSGFIHLFKQLGQKRYEELFDRIVPAYGHGQALDFPDLPYLRWSYQYDDTDEFNGCYKEVKIDNKSRYRRAFTKIRTHLENYLLSHPQYADPQVKFQHFDQLMDTLVTEASDKQREERWLAFLVEHGLFDSAERKRIVYKSDQWLREAFANYSPERFEGREIEGAVLADRFTASKWYQFYLAVEWYKERFYRYCATHQVVIPH